MNNVEANASALTDKLAFRCTGEMAKTIRHFAVDDGVSLQDICNRLLGEAVEIEEARRKSVARK